MQGRGQADRRQVGGAVRAAAHVVQGGQVEDAAQVGDAAGVRHRAADVVDELLADQPLAVPDRVEHLADRQRCGGVPADQPVGVGQLGRDRVLQPSERVGLQALAQPGRLDRGEPVVHVVQQAQPGPELVADPGHHRWQVGEVALGGPDRLARDRRVGRLVDLAPAHPVGRRQTGDAGLDPHRAVPVVDQPGDLGQQARLVESAGVAVDRDAEPGPPAEQPVDRQAGDLAEDVPQGRVDRGDRRHRHRPAPPVGAAVEVLPGVLDLRGVPADQRRDDVLGQIGGHRQLPAVEGGVTDPGDPLVGDELQSHEVAARARGDDPRLGDSHRARLHSTSSFTRATNWVGLTKRSATTSRTSIIAVYITAIASIDCWARMPAADIVE